ncbi:hypothetical protein [Streptomyces avidinii]|uniref:hypothetical protein n=1 Tax=Streptomyces avidinii TaxID=1895 RepID=UPI001FDA00B1|nr:hypothetical protein [Streptomyces avidinii]
MEVDERGLVGDRLYPVRDADGKLGSGKNTRRSLRAIATAHDNRLDVLAGIVTPGTARVGDVLRLA